MSIEKDFPNKAKKFTLGGLVQAISESPFRDIVTLRFPKQGMVEMGGHARVGETVIKLDVDEVTPNLGDKAYIHRQGLQS